MFTLEHVVFLIEDFFQTPCSDWPAYLIRLLEPDFIKAWSYHTQVRLLSFFVCNGLPWEIIRTLLFKCGTSLTKIKKAYAAYKYMSTTEAHSRYFSYDTGNRMYCYLNGHPHRNNSIVRRGSGIDRYDDVSLVVIGIYLLLN